MGAVQAMGVRPGIMGSELGVKREHSRGVCFLPAWLSQTCGRVCLCCGCRRWAAARSAVSGRFVNAYSSNDWVLGVVFRYGNTTVYTASVLP